MPRSSPTTGSGWRRSTRARRASARRRRRRARLVHLPHVVDVPLSAPKPTSLVATETLPALSGASAMLRTRIAVSPPSSPFAHSCHVGLLLRALPARLGADLAARPAAGAVRDAGGERRRRVADEPAGIARPLLVDAQRLVVRHNRHRARQRRGVGQVEAEDLRARTIGHAAKCAWSSATLARRAWLMSGYAKQPGRERVGEAVEGHDVLQVPHVE